MYLEPTRFPGDIWLGFESDFVTTTKANPLAKALGVSGTSDRNRYYGLDVKPSIFPILVKNAPHSPKGITMFVIERMTQFTISNDFRTEDHGLEVATLEGVKAEWQRFVAWANGRQMQGACLQFIRMVVTHTDSNKALILTLECEYEDGDQTGWFLDMNKETQWETLAYDPEANACESHDAINCSLCGTYM